MDSAPDSSPTFLNGFLNVLLDHFAKQSGLSWVEQNGFTGNENMLADPTLGPPTAMISGSYQFLDGTYHTSADRVGELDPQRMAHAAALMATAAYSVAAASADEAAWFAQQAFSRSRRRITDVAQTAIHGEFDCLEERLAYLAEIESEAIASVSRLSTDPVVCTTVDALRGSLAELVEQESASAGVPQCEGARDEGLWREAASMIPLRVVPGPIALQDASDAMKEEFLAEEGKPVDSVEWYGGAPNIFWVDGKRDLAQICKLTRLSQPALYDDQALDAMMKLYTFLDKHGYLRMHR